MAPQIITNMQSRERKSFALGLGLTNECNLACDEQDAQRGPGNWELVHEQAGRCRRLGVHVTFIAVMMRTNFDRLAEIASIAKAYDAPLRINVYQAVRSDLFALTYDEYWTGFQRLFDKTDVLAIG